MQQVGKTISGSMKLLFPRKLTAHDPQQWQRVSAALRVAPHITTRPLDVYIEDDPFSIYGGGNVEEAFSFLDYLYAVAQFVEPKNRYRFSTAYPNLLGLYLFNVATPERIRRAARRILGTNADEGISSIMVAPKNVMIGATLDAAQGGGAENNEKIRTLISLPAASRWLDIRSAQYCPAFDGYVNIASFAAVSFSGSKDIATESINVRKIHWVTIDGDTRAIDVAVLQCADTATPLYVVGLTTPGASYHAPPTMPGMVNEFPLSYRIRQWPSSYNVPGLTPRSFDYVTTRDLECLYVCDCGNVDEYYIGKNPPCSAECGRHMFQAWPGDGRRPARYGPAPFSLVQVPVVSGRDDPASREAPYQVQAIDGGRSYIAPLDGVGEMEPADAPETAQQVSDASTMPEGEG